MYENTYPIDTAASILGCTQKKILTEWAKGTIKIALDFGPESSINRQSYTDYDKWGYPAKQWNIASISAPATNDYFPPELLQPSKLFHDDDEPESIYHQYSQSGFFFDSDYSAAQVRDGKLMVVSNVLLYGLWTVPYAEFSRVHIQDTFTLNPYTNNLSLSKVTATFTPRGGSRRINTPEKKNLRITDSEMTVMKKILAQRPGHQRTEQPTDDRNQEKQDTHGGVERFALEREKVLAAALYVAYHFPKDVGKTLKSHAEAIEKHGYLFWDGNPTLTPDAGRIAKMLSDARRLPNEWKILGGNAKAKR
ncbi:TPA: hypothetical protein RXQ19_003193 [Escherichia coli]|nr:hypothetical protein [Escherichia coli]HEA8840602.1 hypothetical protein [Escherichia coli]